MTELLLIPIYEAPARPLAEWVDAFARRGHAPEVEPDGSDGAVFAVAGLVSEGYAELGADGGVAALHLALAGPDDESARAVVETVAADLGYEVHLDEDDDDVEDD